jgi:hypothetical protein
MTLFGWLRESNGKQSQVGSPGRRSQRVASTRPRLEELEDRVTPATIDTVTNVTISITPNIVSRTATETVTATVTQSGTTTPVTTGTVAFNLNNQTGDAGLSSTGTATFSTTLPLYAVVANQTLAAQYSDPTDTFNESAFLSPVYLNVLNAVLPSQITFGTPPATTSPPTFNSASGETNTVSLFSLPITFNYIDPGTIENFTILGFTLPGSLSATLFADAQSAIVSASTQLI